MGGGGGGPGGRVGVLQSLLRRFDLRGDIDKDLVVGVTTTTFVLTTTLATEQYVAMCVCIVYIHIRSTV